MDLSPQCCRGGHMKSLSWFFSSSHLKRWCYFIGSAHTLHDKVKTIWLGAWQELFIILPLAGPAVLRLVVFNRQEKDYSLANRLVEG